MRTKTLLCMAALAAGVATTMAQNVYSLNIVGYANVQCDSGFHAYSNPFNTGTNGANEVFPAPLSQWNDTQILEWTGVGYNITVFTDDTTVSTTGFSNSAGDTAKPVPILGGGKGFLVSNPNASNNIVFAGTVRTGTNTVVINGPQIKAVGSPLPYAGTITSLGFTNTGGVLNDMQFMRLKTATPTGGASVGFDITVWTDDTAISTTGFCNTAGDTPKPEPTVAIGQGWLMLNPNAPYNWVQILNP